MSIDRTLQPSVKRLEAIHIQRPERIIMSNGAKLNVISAGDQEVTRLDLMFRAGSYIQAYKLQAYFTHRMLREGTEKYSAAQIEEKLDYYGAWLEISNTLEFTYLTLYSLNKYFDEVMELFESIVKEPTFPEKELETTLATSLQQFRVSMKKVDFVARRTLLTGLFGEQHPCGAFAVAEDYGKVEPHMLRAFYKQHYHSANCTLFISGKVTDSIISRIEAAFGTLWGEANSPTKQIAVPLFTLPEKRIFVEQSDALQSAVKLGTLSISHANPDYMKLRVLITLLGGYFGSRLMSNIREDKGYTYGISMGLVQYPDAGVMVIGSETDNRYVASLIQEVYHEIDRLQNEPVTPEELELVKNYMIGETCRSYESPFSLSDAWITVQSIGLNEDFYERSLTATLSVTPEELRELACRYICKESLKEVVVGKKLS